MKIFFKTFSGIILPRPNTFLSIQMTKAGFFNLLQPMRQIEHNAPGFHYKIYWKMDAPGENWNIEEIFDWKSSRLQIPDQPTYQRYMIKIGMHVLDEIAL